MLSKILKPHYMVLTNKSIKQLRKGFSMSGKNKKDPQANTQQSNQAQQEQKQESQEKYEEQSQQQQDEDQHQKEFEDEEEDFQDQYQEEQPLSRRLLKWGIFLGVSSLFWVNGKIAKDNDYDESLAQKERYYIWPVYYLSSKATKNLMEAYQYLLYPPMKKFLPDELPLNPKLMRKTLVLNFEGTMYSKDMKTGEGLVLHLRPGFRKFLKQMAQKYEIVIFSKEDMNFLSEVIKTVDPHRMFFPFFFGNEFLAQQFNGKMLKDLAYLNRSPKRTVVVDFDQQVYKNAKHNVVYLEKYEGQEEDEALKKLGFFLDHLSKPDIPDVRREIKKYGGFDEAVDNYKSSMDDKYKKLKNKNSFFTKKFIGINKRPI